MLLMVRSCGKDHIYKLNEHEHHQKVINMSGKASENIWQYEIHAVGNLLKRKKLLYIILYKYVKKIILYS